MGAKLADRPILFSAPMVRALLAGNKTQTRRVLDFPSIEKVVEFVRVAFDRDTGVPIYEMKDACGGFVQRPAGKHSVTPHWSPRFAVGDQLWVREAWRVTRNKDAISPRDLPPRMITTVFEAGGSMGGTEAPPKDRPRSAAEYVHDMNYPAGPRPEWVGRLRAGMHMPRWASRLTLAVTEVRVQRLQEISEADAQAEGVVPTWPDGVPIRHDGTGRICIDEYRTLWDSLNADRGFGWDANPWVVAVTFDVERRNIDEVPV